jgi:hypothetical protein
MALNTLVLSKITSDKAGSDSQKIAACQDESVTARQSVGNDTRPIKEKRVYKRTPSRELNTAEILK